MRSSHWVLVISEQRHLVLAGNGVEAVNHLPSFNLAIAKASNLDVGALHHKSVMLCWYLGESCQRASQFIISQCYFDAYKQVYQLQLVCRLAELSHTYPDAVQGMKRTTALAIIARYCQTVGYSVSDYGGLTGTTSDFYQAMDCSHWQFILALLKEHSVNFIVNPTGELLLFQNEHSFNTLEKAYWVLSYQCYQQRCTVHAWQSSSNQFCLAANYQHFWISRCHYQLCLNGYLQQTIYSQTPFIATITATRSIAPSFYRWQKDDSFLPLRLHPELTIGLAEEGDGYFVGLTEANHHLLLLGMQNESCGVQSQAVINEPSGYRCQFANQTHEPDWQLLGEPQMSSVKVEKSGCEIHCDRGALRYFAKRREVNYQAKVWQHSLAAIRLVAEHSLLYQQNYGQLYWQAGDKLHLTAEQFSLQASNFKVASYQGITKLTASSIKTQAGKLQANACQQLKLNADTIAIVSQKSLRLLAADTGIMISENGCVTLFAEQINLTAVENIRCQAHVNFYAAKREGRLFHDINWPISKLAWQWHDEKKRLSKAYWLTPWLSATETASLSTRVIGLNDTVVSGNVQLFFCQSKPDNFVAYPKQQSADEQQQLQQQFNFNQALDYGVLKLAVPKLQLGKLLKSGLSYWRFIIYIDQISQHAVSNALQMHQTLSLAICDQHNVAWPDGLMVAVISQLIPGQQLKKPLSIGYSSAGQADFTEISCGQAQLLAFNAYWQQAQLFIDEKSKHLGLLKKITVAPDHSEHQIRMLSPPLIANFRHDADPSKDKNVRLNFTSLECARIKANGNNLTLFIHGFNVGHGAFAKQKLSLPKVVHSQASLTIERTVWQKGSDNGSGACAWLVMMEQHFNRAAFKNKPRFANFTRMLHVFWSGDPSYPIDYLAAVERSQFAGNKLANLLTDLAKKLPGVKINCVAHSLGNAVLLHALEYLSKVNAVKPTISQIFLWQPALPANAFDAVKTLNSRFSGFAKALEPVNKISLLYSRDDNILGPLLPAKPYPPDKPNSELILAILLQALNLASIYQLAVALLIPVTELFDVYQQERVYQRYRSNALKSKSSHLPFSLAEYTETLIASGRYHADFALIEQKLHQAKKRIANALKAKGQRLAAVISNVINEGLIHSHLIQALLFVDDAKPDNIIKLEQHRAWHYSQRMLRQLIVLIGLVRQLNPDYFRPAMGYAGVAIGKLPKSLAKKFHQIDQTGILTSHSAMKEANETLFEKIFCQQIFGPQGIECFGKYSKTVKMPNLN